MPKTNPKGEILLTVIDLATKKYIPMTDDTRLICALGNFDGVHIGHRKLLQRVLDEKKKYGDDGNVKTAVWTFSEHPSIYLGNGEKSKCITELEEKLAIFGEMGIDIAVLEDFTEVRDMTPKEFADALYEKYHVREAICGFNYRFGAKGKGTPVHLAEYMEKYGVKVICIEPVVCDEKIVSSTLIRLYIENGETEKAAKLLGRPFSINFPVVKGNQFGRKIGIPTINQRFSKYHIHPARGIYACTCNIEGDIFLGVANVGFRPTVNDDTCDINCETHIMNYHGWLYGKRIKVSFYKKLRDERKFSNIEELKKAIKNDIKNTENYFSDK